MKSLRTMKLYLTKSGQNNGETLFCRYMRRRRFSKHLCYIRCSSKIQLSRTVRRDVHMGRLPAKSYISCRICWYIYSWICYQQTCQHDWYKILGLVSAESRILNKFRRLKQCILNVWSANQCTASTLFFLCFRSVYLVELVFWTCCLNFLHSYQLIFNFPGIALQRVEFWNQISYAESWISL